MWYTAAELNINATTRKGILYVEGIGQSEAGNAIRVEVDPEGLDGEYFVASDVVKANIGKHVVTGKIEYLAKVITESFVAPVRHAWVELHTETRTYKAATNDAGEFVIHIDDPNVPILFIDVLSTSEISSDRRKVRTYAGTTLGQWRDISLRDYVPTGAASQKHVDLTGAFAINSDQGLLNLQAFQTCDALVAAAVFSEGLAGTPNSTTDVYVTREIGPQTHTSLFNTMLIPQVYASNWDIIQHEYGHVVASEMGFHPSLPFTNLAHEPNFNVRNSIGPSVSYTKSNQLAFAEGWANFFAVVAQAEGYVPPSSVPGVTGIDGAKWLGINFEAKGPDQGVGEDEETTIARVLWDLYDDADDNGDTISSTPSALVQSLISLTQTSGYPTLRALWGQLTELGTSFSAVQG